MFIVHSPSGSQYRWRDEALLCLSFSADVGVISTNKLKAVLLRVLLMHIKGEGKESIPRCFTNLCKIVHQTTKYHTLLKHLLHEYFK